MTRPTLKVALVRWLAEPNLTKANRAHIERWLGEVNDPVWEQVAADADRCGVVDDPYSYFILSALLTRSYVQTELDKPALLKKLEQERTRQKFDDWTSLADMMDEVARRYGEFEQRNVRPDPSGRRPESESPLRWLKQEAQKIRQRAQKLLGRPNLYDWGRIRVNVSRQSGGKRKRRDSRKINVFIQLMVNCMYKTCGKPRYHAVATITNIAFPAARVDADHVRSACRPTTRAGRGDKSGTPTL